MVASEPAAGGELSGWRWLRRALTVGMALGFVVGVVVGVLGPPDQPSGERPVFGFAVLGASFALLLAIPFGLVCRVVFGSQPAPTGVVGLAAVTPAVFGLFLATDESPPGVALFATLIVGPVLSGTAAWLYVRSERP